MDDSRLKSWPFVGKNITDMQNNDELKYTEHTHYGVVSVVGNLSKHFGIRINRTFEL